MKLLNTLSHMPFQAGGALYFCESYGPVSFTPRQTEFSKNLGVQVQPTSYQPWSLAKLIDGAVTSIDGGLPNESPMRLFCNPVVIGDSLSFIYNRKLWVSPLLDTLVPSVVIENVYTGFVGEGLTVYSELKTPNSFIIDSGGSIESVSTDFTNILRIVPSEGNLIITGNLGADTFSLLRHPDGNLFRIQVLGHDVYKCCIVGSDVIHAVKNNGFEDRYLHRDPVELVPYA